MKHLTTTLLLTLLVSGGLWADDEMLLCEEKPNTQVTCKYVYDNGNIYMGSWRDGKRDGQGTLTISDGGKYVGEWKDGVVNGQGTLTFPDGGKYVGEWKDGKRDGQGTETFSDGRKYIGEWKDGEYQKVRSAADCYEDRYRKVDRLAQIHNSVMEQYRSISQLPPHIIENATDRYMEDVRRATEEYEECKKGSGS